MDEQPARGGPVLFTRRLCAAGRVGGAARLAVRTRPASGNIGACQGARARPLAEGATRGSCEQSLVDGRLERAAPPTRPAARTRRAPSGVARWRAARFRVGRRPASVHNTPSGQASQARQAGQALRNLPGLPARVVRPRSRLRTRLRRAKAVRRLPPGYDRLARLTTLRAAAHSWRRERARMNSSFDLCDSSGCPPTCITASG